MRMEKNTQSTSALTERSLSWERSEKLNCKLVNGSGSGRSLLASLMALWRGLAGTDEQGRLVTTGGFVVPEGYLKIAHGYPTTSHSSQGLTANFSVVFGASFDQKAIYVSHSRARERVDTYVPMKEGFLS